MIYITGKKENTFNISGDPYINQVALESSEIGLHVKPPEGGHISEAVDVSGLLQTFRNAGIRTRIGNRYNIFLENKHQLPKAMEAMGWPDNVTAPILKAAGFPTDAEKTAKARHDNLKAAFLAAGCPENQADTLTRDALQKIDRVAATASQMSLVRS